MSFTLPDLPYPADALAPVVSDRTLSFHHGKHHATYVTNLNNLVAGTPHEGKSLDDVIMAADPGPLFNNAAQHWNHDFYWKSMTPGGGGDPDGALKAAIDASFGSVDTFKSTFADKAKTLFGSGWTWLAQDETGKLQVVQTKDADLPMKHGMNALMVIDVWEHAYYLDHQNARAAYVDAWLDKLVNWELAASRLSS
jgi:superoxide dismutase, Fe-Mn family